jgi:biotin operon repressor/DNA-binding MarR family transcriptional regulator
MVVQLETSESTLGSFTGEELQIRYGIDRSSVFRRFQDLTAKGYHMKSVGKRGRYSIYSAEQVAIMDAFAKHLDGKGLVRDFPAAGQQTLLLESNDATADTTPDSRQYSTLASGSAVSRVVSDRAPVSDAKERAEPLATKGSFLAVLNQLLTTDVRDVQKLFLSLKQSCFGNPAAKRGMVLAPQRELLDAARNEIELSTEQVAYLLGVEPDTITKYGDRFEDAGFIFFRVGKRKNRQIAWGVVKKPKRFKELLAALDQVELKAEAE